MQISYVGSQGHRLWRFFDISQPSTAQINAADIACDCINDFSGAARPLNGNPYGAFYVLQENSTGKSNYNALQASFRLTGWHGVTSILNYVWSKSLDNSSDGEDFEPNDAQPNDSTRPNLEYGPSSFNLPQRLTWNFAYDLPTRGGSMQKLKNGWGLNSVLTMQSGQPFHFNYNFEDDFSGSGNAFDRPDVVGPITYHKSDSLQLRGPEFLCHPMHSQCHNGFRRGFGLRPSVLRHVQSSFRQHGQELPVGPDFREWNFSIYKKTAITERVNMKLGVDFFNIVNHPNFANPLLPAFIADPGLHGFQIKGNREVGDN